MIFRKPVGIIKAKQGEFYNDSLGVYINYYYLICNMHLNKIDNNLLRLEYSSFKFYKKSFIKFESI